MAMFHKAELSSFGAHMMNSMKEGDPQPIQPPIGGPTDILDEDQLARLARSSERTQDKGSTVPLPDPARVEVPDSLFTRLEQIRQELTYTCQSQLAQMEIMHRQRTRALLIGCVAGALLVGGVLSWRVGELTTELNQTRTQVLVLDQGMRNAQKQLDSQLKGAEKRARQELAQEKTKALEEFRVELDERQARALSIAEERIDARVAIEKRQVAAELESRIDGLIRRRAKEYGVQIPSSKP